MENKRVTRRRALRAAAKVLLNAGRSLNAKVADLASGGISLLVPEQLSTDQSCVIVFALPSAGGTRPVSLKARVLYAHAIDGQSFRTGLKFVDIDTVSAWVLWEFASQQIDEPPVQDDRVAYLVPSAAGMAVKW